MLTIGILAFIAGMVAGFLSLRALGWMCIIGLCVCSQAYGSATFYFTDPDPSGATYPSGAYNVAVCSTGGTSGGGWVYPGAGTLTVTVSGTAPYTISMGNYPSGVNSGCANGPCTINSATPGTYSKNCGTPPPPYYSMKGCVTNTSQSGIQGYYLHCTKSDGTTFDWYSGPLGPGQSACVDETNSLPFSCVPEQIFYNTDGGTNELTTGPPVTAGTNSQTTGSWNQGPGGIIQQTGGATGAGNQTNLTGSQYSVGVSNLVGAIAGQGNLTLPLLSQIAFNTSSNSQPDYRGYLVTLTNQGSGMLSMQQVNTNLLGQLYTQVVQVGLMDATNFGWMTNWVRPFTNYLSSLTNQEAIFSNNWWTVTNPASGFSNSASGLAMAFSNSFLGASSGQDGGGLQGTNFGNNGGSSVFSLLDIGVVTNTARQGPLRLRFTDTNLWTQFTPWARGLGFFITMFFAVGYIHWRVQDEMIKLQLVPTPGWSAGGIAAKVTGTIATLATLIGAVPLLIGSGVAYLLGLGGGSATSPFSDAGMAAAGSYLGAVQLGYQILNALFPWQFAVATMIYLFVFDQVVTGAILAAQRWQKLTQ